MSLLCTEPAVLDERLLRDAYGRFATGVAFVAADVEGRPLGLVVSSFAAVSLDPPLVSFCPSRSSLTWRRMRGAGAFTIRVLGEHEAGFARRAGRPGADRFAEPLTDVVATIECDLDAEHPAGDHWIVVGAVRAVEVHRGRAPLVYYAGRLGAFDPVETSSRPTPASRSSARRS